MKIKLIKCTGAKVGLRGKFIALDAYVRKSNISSHIKKLEKEQSKHKCKKEVIKIRVNVNESENRKAIEKNLSKIYSQVELSYVGINKVGGNATGK